MENTNDLTAKVLLRIVAQGVSIALDPNNWALGKNEKEWAEKALSRPVYRGDDPQPAQNPDGSFPFTLGYDTLGSSTL